MTEKKQSILVVEDDLDVADLINAYFSVQGYNVLIAHWGADGVRVCQENPPDLVILDIRLPDIDGFRVAKALRSDRKTSHIPIIFLTEKSERDDRLQGLEMGVEDYITKPFDIQELRLRVRNTIKRAQVDSRNNPITGLPDGSIVEEQMDICLHSTGLWAMVVVSIQNLDIFRETYGFIASDDVLRAASLMIQNMVVHYVPEHKTFLGHLGACDFLLITSSDEVEGLEMDIRNRLEQSLGFFYPIKDRERQSGGVKYLKVITGILRATDGVFLSVLEIKKALLAARK